MMYKSGAIELPFREHLFDFLLGRPKRARFRGKNPVRIVNCTHWPRMPLVEAELRDAFWNLDE